MIGIDRAKYYKNDYEGFAIFLLSRLYNDLQINETLFNSLKREEPLYDDVRLYLFKILISHLKEGLKILGKMKRSPYYKQIVTKWRTNKIIDDIFNDISDELEKPINFPNTTNAKYLNLRNDVFHYCIEPKDFDIYKTIQSSMIEQNLNVLIEEDNNKYGHETAVDIQLVQESINDVAIDEINKLKNKVLTLSREILNDYYKGVK